uniref:Uncharacterized protein n=1 Tax=Cacopsylla melanoneura TaxID=428564 RepID=A0A8D8Q131_9HEMI
MVTLTCEFFLLLLRRNVSILNHPESKFQKGKVLNLKEKHSNFHNFLITYGAFVLITTISDLFYLLNRKPTLMLKLRALDLIKSSSYYITYHCTEPDRYR